MRKPTLSLNSKRRYDYQHILWVIFWMLIPVLAFSNNHNLNKDQHPGSYFKLSHSDTDTYTTLLFVDIECCDNATNLSDGQYQSTIEIKGLASTFWYVTSAIGYYVPNDCEDPAPIPIEFIYGPMGNSIFTEEPIVGTDSSIYTLDVMTVDGELNQIRLESSRGDVVTILGQSPEYGVPEVSGPISVCSNQIVEYHVENGFTDHLWTIVPNTSGTIIGSDKAQTVKIQWGDIGQLIYSGTALNGGCFSPVSLNVSVGDPLIGAMVCKSPMNLSLNGTCELQITPAMVLSDSHDPTEAPFAVMLTGPDGKVVPEATFTHKDAGKTFEVKVLDGCGGNSCWTSIKVEDKLSPQILCSPDTVDLPCHKVNAYSGPLVSDNCDVGVRVMTIDSVRNNFACDPDYTGMITKTYIAEDKFGNQSSPCTQVIRIERLELDSIKAPARFLMNCAEYDGDAPHPDISGVPTLDGESLYPMDVNGFCNIVTTYYDEEVGNIGCTRKVVRYWNIYEWHCDDPFTKTIEQYFEIKDTVPPQILSKLDDLTVSAGVGNCQAMVLLPAILTEDDCFDEDVQVIVKDRLNSNGGVIMLEEGVHEIKYIVSDKCGNSDSISIDVTVEDKTPPVAVCLDSTTVSLDIYGEAYVPARVFDRGSHDACDIGDMQVRRMEDAGVSCVVSPETFGPSVQFCCEDAGKVRMVEYRVFDTNGNSNTCMVEVIVQDKFPPSLTVPADATIDCGTYYDLDDLSDFGSFTVQDACGVTIDSMATDSVSSCGTGLIWRTWIVSDANGSSSGTQVIKIVNDDVFDMDPDDWPLDFESDVFCGNSDVNPDNLPEGYQRPAIENGLCSSVSATYVDDMYPFPGSNSDACFKILRTWSVIDWCQLDINGSPRRWSHDQVIKIRNTDKPVITSDLSPVDSCSTECDAGFIALSATAYDTCTIAEDLTWTYNIDYFDDGSIDSTLSGHGDTARIAGMFPLGTHRILWTFYDQCGNQTTEGQLFTISNCKGPVASAKTGLTIGLVPMDLQGNDGIPDMEMACLQAETVNGSSYHPCGIPITFSFSRDTTDKEMCFNCFDLGVNKLYLYVTDIFGNVDSVLFMVDVQDNNDVDICNDPRDCIEFPVDTMVTACNADLSPSGLLSMPIVDPDCICTDYNLEFADDTLTNYPGSECIYIRRTWTVTFNCGLNPIISEAIQNISVLNLIAPTLSCPIDVTVETTGNTCEADVTLDTAIVSGSCNSGLIITNNVNSGGADASGFYNIGINTVEYIAVDACGNADTCMTNITIIDGGNPICNVQDITVMLDEMGNAMITSADLDNGSADACSAIDTIIINKSTFTCSDAGTNDVEVTVVDELGNDTTCIAVVTVIDTIGPICVPQDITVALTDTDARYFTPEMVDGGSTDDCGSVVNRTLSRDSVTCDDLGLMVTTTLTVFDNNQNSSSCIANITVVDSVAPICIPQDITIGIGLNGITILPDTIDNGSFDPCGMLVTYELDDSTFTCADIGSNMVVLTVTDANGNSSECDATVTVVDQTIVTCAANDITVYLDDSGNASITPQDIDNGSSAGCVNAADLSLDITDFTCDDLTSSPITVELTVTAANGSSDCTAEVTVIDSIAPVGEVSAVTIPCEDNVGNLASIGGLTITENCTVDKIDTMITNTALNTCGIGFVTRRFIITDQSGNIDTTMEQLITIEGGMSQFTINDINFATETTNIASCNDSTDPIDIGSETTVDDTGATCAQVVIDYEDTVISSGLACTDTIQRVWIVVDSCQFNAITMDGIWRDTQLLVVSDNVAPVVTAPADMTIANPGSVQNCNVVVSLASATATDDCTPDNQLIITNDINGGGADASGTYAPGTYTIRFTTMDKCGNIGIDSMILVVEDPSGEGISCTKVIANITSTGSRTLTLSQFSVFQATGCYDPTGLTFAFDDVDQDSTTLTFTCADVGQKSPGNALGINVDIYSFNMGVLDDSCRTTVDVRDPNNNCSTNAATLVGSIRTSAGDDVEGVTVILESDQDYYTITDADGSFAFSDILKGSVFNVKPYKVDDVLNGVSTLDILKIQRHILGTDQLSSEYELVAADIDHSMHVSALDILALRKTILGVYDEFPNNTSWRMIDSGYTFPEYMNPFAESWPESYQITGIEEDMSIGFTGVKIGDVSGDAIANNSRSIHHRSLPETFLAQRVREGKVDLIVTDDVTIYGFQFSANVSGQADYVKSDLEIFGDDNYAIHDGNIKVSWSNTEAIELGSGQVLMTIYGDDGISVSLDKGLSAEVYGDKDEIYALRLTKELPVGMQINAATPNPWSDYTIIDFSISYDDEVSVRFFDASGKLILQKDLMAHRGDNNFRINKDEINVSGIVYYDLITSREKQQGKMIVIK